MCFTVRCTLHPFSVAAKTMSLSINSFVLVIDVTFEAPTVFAKFLIAVWKNVGSMIDPVEVELVVSAFLSVIEFKVLSPLSVPACM